MSSPQSISRTGQFPVVVASVETLSPRMRRLWLRSPQISEQHWPLACDIAVVLTGEDGREVRRRYTVRKVDDDRLALDAVLHGHGPGSTWAASAAAGDPVVFYGPRGTIDLTEASPVLALTDEAGLPAVAALAEAGGRPLRVFAEIADAAEVYPLPANAEVTWLPRGTAAAGDPGGLITALDRLEPAEIPGYAYVLAESRAAVAVREALSRFGLSRADVYAKGYWNLNSRSGR